MSLHTELLLFEPERGVVFGMPIFIGSDVALFRRLLRHHGEWWDNASLWMAGYLADPKRIEVRGSFNGIWGSPNKYNGKRYARELIPHLTEAWRVEPAPEQGEFRDMSGAAGSASIALPRAWFAYRNEMPTPITARRPGQLLAQQGYWFPCDGAVALVLPESTSAGPMQLAATEWLMRDVELIERLRSRAECCFLFRISLDKWRPNKSSRRTDIRWGRRSQLHERQGCLVEADFALVSELQLEEGPR